MFNRLDYAECFGHLGRVRSTPTSPLSVIVRSIGSTGYADGMLAPPYGWLDADDLTDLANTHPDLVTITGVLAPGLEPGRGAPTRRYKEHFVLDPDLPPPALSKRTRAHIRRGEKRWRIDPSTPPTAREVSLVFGQMIARRSLGATQHGHPDEHFEQLLQIDGVTALGVHDGTQWGSIAVVASGPDGAHVLHAVTSDLGLRTDAGPVLMSHLTREHRAAGTPLFIGGVPDHDPGGMTRFKRRWSNTTRPVHLITIVNRPEVSHLLCGPNDEAAAFFPAYRAAPATR